MKFEKITDINRSCLSDESRLEGDADYIVFCESVDDVQEAVMQAVEKGWGITVQGSRTGITGGAVPARHAEERENPCRRGGSFSGRHSEEVDAINEITAGNNNGPNGEALLCRDRNFTGRGNSSGICGLSGEAVINLSRMKQVFRIRQEGCGVRIKAGSGLSLTEIENILKGEVFDTSLLDDESLETLDILRKGNFFFPPDPTEKSASIGGVVANCASGSRTFHYGSARNFITSLDIILADSSQAEVNRTENHYKAEGFKFSLPLSSGKVIEGELPELYSPDCKTAAGLMSEKNMDLIDLFIGSEGILGIIASVEFIVIPEPLSVNGILIFPPERESNLRLAEIFCTEGRCKYSQKSGEEKSCRKNDNKKDWLISGSCRIAAVEYFDSNAISLLQKYIEEGSFRTLFPFSENCIGGALYVEIHSDDPGGSFETLQKISDFLEKEGVRGSSVFVSDGESDLRRMKEFRHSVPESVNMTIDRIRKQGNDITKLGTDMAVPDGAFRELFKQYYSDLEKFSSGSARENQLSDNAGYLPGINYAVFGHIGNSHLHVNIIPGSRDEYIKGKKLVRKWAEKAVSLGGTVSAEHGTGRLKKEYLELMYGKEGIGKIEYVKSIFDPGSVINRGVMI